ncbi:glycoside hydrolase family 57 protein [bacterium]
MNQELGYLCLVLHAHLPFVRHPEYEDFLEEDWLYEAITETYIPLISVFDRLIDENIDFRMTMSLTPPLCSMLNDTLLRHRYSNYLSKHIELIEKELIRTKDVKKLYETAKMYEEKLKGAQYIFEHKYNRDIIKAFRKFQDLGKLEIITCGATHGFLPHMINENNVRAQIEVACNDYKHNFGRSPRGIWLPECAYIQGLDKILKEYGIKFFFIDTHGILFGTPESRFGVHAPVMCPSGVYAFARDDESSKQVWSSEAGYPGDPAYREFYRDAGYDLEYEYIKPYLHSDGVRRNIGLKYHKITGKVPLAEKQYYSVYKAKEVCARHAGNFVFNREKQVEHLYNTLGRKPIIISPYDAELFGHWWYEGPDFIEFLIRKVYYDQNTVSFITPSEYIAKYPEQELQVPANSSWGDKGYYEVWLNGSNDWIYRHLHKLGDLMVELANNNPAAQGMKKRALNQAAREVLLAQSSDWAFIMTTGTMIEYAEKRTKDHINRFFKLYDAVKNDNYNEELLTNIEYRDNIFPHIDYKVYMDKK